MLFPQPRAERRKQVLRRHVQFVAQGFGGLLELGEVIAVGLDQVAHPLDRIGLVVGAAVAVGDLGRPGVSPWRASV